MQELASDLVKEEFSSLLHKVCTTIQKGMQPLALVQTSLYIELQLHCICIIGVSHHNAREESLSTYTCTLLSLVRT